MTINEWKKKHVSETASARYEANKDKYKAKYSTNQPSNQKQSGGMNPQSVAQSIADEHNRNENVREIGLANSIAREHDDAENVRAVRMPDALSMLRTTSSLANRVRDYQNAANISSEHDMQEDVRGAALRMLAEKVSREHDWNEDAKTPESRRMRASAYADELTRGIQAGTMGEEERKRLAYQMRREATSGNLIENHFNNTDAFSEEELNELSRLFNLATRGRVENAMAGIGSWIAANLSALPSAVAQDASDWKEYREQYDGDYWKDFFTQPMSEVRQNQVDAGFTGRPMDESSFARKTYGISQEQKNAATAGLSENGVAGTKYFSPKWLAEQGISVVENAPNMLLTAMNPAVGTAYMVGNAGGNRALELSEQGVNAGEAVQRGLVSGAIEALTEKYSIENFLDAFTNNRGALLNILSQMGVEASEESASYVLNYAADLAARDPNAEFSVAELIDNAMGGAFSGGIYGGIGQVGRAVGNAAARTSGIRDAAEQEQSRTAQNATTAPIPAESFAQGETTPAESVLDRAMREQAERGSVSNSTAEAILADSDAMAALSVRTENSMTKSQQRAAVKDAVAARIGAQERAVSETGNETTSDTENAAQAEKTANPATQNAVREVADAVQNTPVTREVVEADLAALEAVRGLLGENGAKSIRALYDGRQGTIGADELYRSYLPYYEAGINGRDMSMVETRYRGVLNEVETKIAYEAGQMDAAKSMQAEKAAASGVIVYHRKTAGATAQTGVKVDRNTMRTLDSAAKALGVKIIVEQQLEGGANGYIRNGEIHLSATARNPLLVVAAHEITHRMQDMSPESYRAYRDYVMNALSTARGGSVASLIQSKIDSYQRSQVNSGFGQALTAEQAMDELAADFTREMMHKTDLFERFAKQNRTAAQKLLDAVRSFIRKVKSMFPKNRAAQNAAAQAEFGADMDILVQAEKLWSKALETAETASVDHANRTDSDNGFSGVRDETVRHSLQNDELFMEKARQKNGSTGFVSASEMDAAEKARSVIANLFRDPALQDALNLPQDVMGNTFLANSSYGGSEENTTVCIRTLAAEYLMDAVAEELGRPLTVEDTIAISQEYWKYTDKPECLYCYVAMDRKAHREFLGEYLRQRDAVVADIRNGMSRTDAYQKFLDGRKDTRQMRDRFNMWAKNAETNAEVITARDLASQRSMEQAAAKSKAMRNQVNDALKYAQSASWAKKRISYKAYNNHILRWTQKRVNDLNDHYGLRMYSFSDFSPAFILENMQMFTDAAVRGLKVLAYTKELDFVRIFAKTGANINISVFAHEQNGQISEDAMQGAPWKEAQELRSQHRNVGCTFVATNDNQVAWALDQDWIDVVIPFHLVRTGSKVAQAFGWKNYTAMSADVKDKANGWDANRDKTGIYPTEHLNDKEKYLAALEENHLKPRFAEWVDHPNYMKLVNETRQSVLQSKAVQPVFDVSAAKKSINDMIKRGGYYVPIGGSEANMRDIAGEIAENIGNKKTALTDGKRFSVDGDKYSFEALVSKSPVEIVPVAIRDIPTKGKKLRTGEIANDARANAGTLFNTEKGVQKYVYIKDINSNVLLAKDGVVHGLQGNKTNSGTMNTAIVSRALPRILRNSIAVNELNPRSEKDGVFSYILFGYVRDSNDQEYIVKSTINHFAYNKSILNSIEIFDVLKGTKAKKSATKLMRSHNDFSSASAANGLVTDTISIEELLDAVKENYPELLPDGILEHYGIAVQKSENLRYSTSENDDLHSATEQAREINRLRAQLERARDQTRRTGAYSVDKRKITKTVRAIFDRYSSDLSGTETESALTKLYSDMEKSLNRGSVDYDDLRGNARKIAEQIAIASEETSDDAAAYTDLRRTLRNTGISISDADKADIPDFDGFRKRNFGRLKITKDGTPVDEFYVHLSEAFPEFFDHERETHPAEQLQRIAEVYEEVSGRKTRNLFGEDMEGAIEDITSDIIGSFFTIPHAKQTFADRQAGKLEAARADAKQSKAELSALTRQYDRDTSALEKTRARALESLEETRTAHAREVQKLRDRFAERTKAGRERQKERELRRRIQKHAEKLSRKLLRPTDKQHVPEELRPVIARALSTIDLTSKNGRETKRTLAFLDLRREYARIAGEDSGMVVDPDLLAQDGLLDQVAQLGDTRIADMNTEQLQTVWKTVRALEHAVVTAGKLLAGTKYAGTAAWADAMMRDTSTFRVRRTTAVSYFATDLETPYTFFSHYGEAGKAIYRMLRDAQDAQQVKTDRIALETAKLVDGKTVRKLQKETHLFDVDGRTLTLTTAHIMELYELSKREQAQEHLMRGGIVQPEIKSAKVERGTESISLSLDQIAEIVGTLTDDQKRIADGLQKMMSTTLADWGNEASMKAYGYKKFTGTDYWPIHSASEGVHQNAEKSEGNARSIKNIGMAKNTIPHASNALDISGVFQTFAGHAADMIDYSTWLCPMEDANRLFNYQYRDENGVKTGQSVMGMLNRYGGQGAQKYWKNLMNDIQNGIKSNDDTRIGRITQKLYSNVKGAAVGANVRVIIQQPTAILRAMTVLDPQYLLGGMVKGKTGGSGWEKAVRYAPIAARKAQGGFDVKSQSTMSEILFDDKSVLSRSSDFLSSGAAKADEITWGRIWNACERQVKAQDKNIDMRTDAFNQKVAELFTEVIDQTQVVDGVLQRSQAMRSSNQIVQQATSFMGEPTQSLNIFLRAWDGVRRESDPKKAAKAAGVAGRAAFALICTDVVNALAQSLVDALRDDDEDKKYLDRVWSSFTGITGDEEEWTEYATNILFGNLGSNMNPAERIPVVKDAISILQGYTVERMDTSGLADFIAAAQDTASLTGNGKKTQRYAVKQLITTGSKLFGISAANLLRDVWAIARSVAIERDDNRSLYAMQKQVFRIGDDRNKKLYLDLAFKAQQDGDSDVVDEIADELISLGILDDREQFDEALYDRLEKKYMDTDEYEQKYSETLNAIGNALDQTGDYMDRGGKFQSNAMKRAKSYAKSTALRDVDLNGELSESYDDLEKYDEAIKYGVTPEEMILFDVAYLALLDEREEWADAHDGEEPETTRKEDVIDMLEEMAWLTNRERSYLYLSKGYSEKNNPF